MSATTSLAPLAQAAIKEVARLEERIGGREVLTGVLAVAPLDKPGTRLMLILADPAYAALPLLEMCRIAGVRPGALLALVEQGLMAASQLEARVHIARGTPKVVADVMKKGAPYVDPCGACGGIGTRTADPTEDEPNPSPQMCAPCQGTGQLLYPADSEARKLALDLSGLLPKSNGITITNTQQVAVRTGGGGDVDLLQEAMDRVLYGHGSAGPAQTTFEAEYTPAGSPEDVHGS